MGPSIRYAPPLGQWSWMISRRAGWANLKEQASKKNSSGVSAPAPVLTPFLGSLRNGQWCGIGSEINPFLLKSLMVTVFYHSNRNTGMITLFDLKLATPPFVICIWQPGCVTCTHSMCTPVPPHTFPLSRVPRKPRASHLSILTALHARPCTRMHAHFWTMVYPVTPFNNQIQTVSI